MAWLVQRGVDWIGALAGTNPPVELGANSVSGGDDNLSQVYFVAADKFTILELHMMIVLSLNPAY